MVKALCENPRLLVIQNADLSHVPTGTLMAVCHSTPTFVWLRFAVH